MAKSTVRFLKYLYIIHGVLLHEHTLSIVYIVSSTTSEDSDIFHAFSAIQSLDMSRCRTYHSLSMLDSSSTEKIEGDARILEVMRYLSIESDFPDSRMKSVPTKTSSSLKRGCSERVFAVQYKSEIRQDVTILHPLTANATAMAAFSL